MHRSYARDRRRSDVVRAFTHTERTPLGGRQRNQDTTDLPSRNGPALGGSRLADPLLFATEPCAAFLQREHDRGLRRLRVTGPLVPLAHFDSSAARTVLIMAATSSALILSDLAR